MADWSDRLIVRINSIESRLAEAIGLQPQMRGDEFEEALGRFLELDSELPLFEQFVHLGAAQLMRSTQEMNAWTPQIRSRCDRVIEAVHESLYENFNALTIDRQAAIKAYRLLTLIMDLAEEDRLVCATTNYDSSLEMALDEIGFRVNDGFVRTYSWETPWLNPDGLVHKASQDRAIAPVLHLHGAVGWYRNEDGRIEYHPADKRFNRSLGTPALLLPDPKKDPSLFAGVDAMWSEFRGALEDADEIYVLGHSLHDKHLVEALTTNGEASLVVLGVFEQSDYERTKALIGEQAMVVALEFGPNMERTLMGSLAQSIAQTIGRPMPD